MAAPQGRRQIVFLSSVDWDSAWQRHHSLASAFAREEREVFFVENTGFRSLRLSDAGRILRRLANALWSARSGRHLHPLPKGVKIVAPLVLPPTNRLFRLLNRHWALPLLLQQLRRRGLGDGPLVFAYLPTRSVLDLLDGLGPSGTVYDVVDNFHGHIRPPRDLARTEGELLERADLVFTTSAHLQRMYERRHPKVLCVHHGVSEDFFLETSSKPGPCRRLCYFGSLRSGLDYAAVNALAQAGFEVALIGPEHEAPPRLHPGVERRGLLPTAQLLRELKRFDALILPYLDNEFNRGIKPAKLYECLATGLPVIASPLPAMRELNGLLYLAATPREFVERARALDGAETEERIAARVQEARRHSADGQFRRMSEELEAALRARRPAAAPAPRPRRLSSTVAAFLKGFAWIAAFFTSAKAATLATQILAARFLGPAEYGHANLVLAANSLLQTLPMLGFPLALARFTPAQPSEPRRSLFLSTALICFGLWAALCLAAWSLAGPWLRTWLGLDSHAWTLAMTLAFATAAHLTISSALQGLTWFKARGAVEALYGLGAFALLAFLALKGQFGYTILIYSLCGGLGLAILAGLWRLGSCLSLGFDRSLLAALLPYVLLGALSTLAAACIQAPGRLILFHMGSAHEAGVYSAYFTATVQIALALMNMVGAVLIPLSSLPEGQREAWREFGRWGAKLAAAAFALFATAGLAALAILGRSYPLRWDWLLLFSAAAAAVLLQGVLSALYAARDLDGLKISAAGTLLAGTGNLLLNFVLTPAWGIAGSALSLLTGYLAALLWYVSKRPKAATRLSSAST